MISCLAKPFSVLPISLVLAALLQGAPYRLNRSFDSALALYVDNSVSATEDNEGGFHVVYTDSDTHGRWHVYHRSLKQDYWSIPFSLSAEAQDLQDNRSPQIIFDPATKNLYAICIGMSRSSTESKFRLLVERVSPEERTDFRVKAFDFGIANFQPRVEAATGRIFLLSEERPARGRTVFHARVYLTESDTWIEKELESNSAARISSPAIAVSQDRAVLFWVQTTTKGHDLMLSAMPAGVNSWSEPRRIFQFPALVEALSVSARGKLLALGFSLRGGARNSILLQMVSRDGGETWKGPSVLYSVAANAAAAMTALSESKIVAFINVSDNQGEKIRMKYSLDAGESWIPTKESEAIRVAPGRESAKAQRFSLGTLKDDILAVAWEEWKNTRPTLVYKIGRPEEFGSTIARVLLTSEPAARFSYYPQVWVAGHRIYVTYGNKRRANSVGERIYSSDLYLTEVHLTGMEFKKMHREKQGRLSR